jgi:hypothetical protein
VESEDNQSQVFTLFPPPLEIAQRSDSHIPTAAEGNAAASLFKPEQEHRTLQGPSIPADPATQTVERCRSALSGLTHTKQRGGVFHPSVLLPSPARCEQIIPLLWCPLRPKRLPDAVRSTNLSKSSPNRLSNEQGVYFARGYSGGCPASYFLVDSAWVHRRTASAPIDPGRIIQS